MCYPINICIDKAVQSLLVNLIHLRGLIMAPSQNNDSVQRVKQKYILTIYLLFLLFIFTCVISDIIAAILLLTNTNTFNLFANIFVARN